MGDGMDVRSFGKVKEIVPVPSLVRLQRESYDSFLDADTPMDERDPRGLEAILREFFPITAFDDKLRVSYHGYCFSPPQHDQAECRDLGLTYQRGLKIRVRVEGEPLGSEVLEEDVHIAYLPIRIGGGEFIINGSERTIVTQIQRSPGVDFSSTRGTSGRMVHSCRIIPERGSWIQVEVTTKDCLQIKIDKSTKVGATTFLRALSPNHGTTPAILRHFFATQKHGLAGIKSKDVVVGKILVEDVIDPDSGEPLIKSCEVIGEASFETIKGLGISEVEVIADETIRIDDILLNTLREDESTCHDEALVRIYRRLRPGSPADEKKVKELFFDRFQNESRYNLGAVGRFRINRKLGVEGDGLTITGEDYIKILEYLLRLIRSSNREGELDDIDHLGNRRIRPIADLLSDEMRAAMLKLRRAVKERLGRDLQQDQDTTQVLAPRALFNSQAVDSAIQNFFQRGELSQVVDQSNLLSQLTHERRLSALGPGGLNRKRAGFEVRDVHTSHYGRICPIETPEGANIGLIVSLSIYATVNEYGFLVTPYRKVVKGRVTDEVIYLMADEEAGYKIGQASVELDAKGQDQAAEVPRSVGAASFPSRRAPRSTSSTCRPSRCWVSRRR
jgi:DNA-directed RNA polymerase subunit beta